MRKTALLLAVATHLSLTSRIAEAQRHSDLVRSERIVFDSASDTLLSRSLGGGGRWDGERGPSGWLVGAVAGALVVGVSAAVLKRGLCDEVVYPDTSCNARALRAGLYGAVVGGVLGAAVGAVLTQSMRLTSRRVSTPE